MALSGEDENFKRPMCLGWGWGPTVSFSSTFSFPHPKQEAECLFSHVHCTVMNFLTTGPEMMKSNFHGLKPPNL